MSSRWDLNPQPWHWQCHYLTNWYTTTNIQACKRNTLRIFYGLPLPFFKPCYSPFTLSWKQTLSLTSFVRYTQLLTYNRENDGSLITLHHKERVCLLRAGERNRTVILSLFIHYASDVNKYTIHLYSPIVWI